MKRPSSACMSHRGRIQPFDTQAWIDLPKPQLSALPETRITACQFPSRLEEGRFRRAKAPA
jgi:hypothetical protein